MALQDLLKPCPLPQGTIFDEHVYSNVSDKIRGPRAHVFRHLTPLVAPSPEVFALLGRKELDGVFETTYFLSSGEDADSWMGLTYQVSAETVQAFAPESSRHQPETLPILHVGVGPTDWSGFWRPEDIASSWARPTLEWYGDLYRLANRLDELKGRPFIFSIVHDNRRLRILGHYIDVVEDGPGESDFEFRARDLVSMEDFIEEDRWVAYRFSHNLYHSWWPEHLQIITDISKAARGFDSPESEENGAGDQPFTDWESADMSAETKNEDDSSLKPLLLAAHHDLVPVEGELSQDWKHGCWVEKAPESWGSGQTHGWGRPDTGSERHGKARQGSSSLPHRHVSWEEPDAPNPHGAMSSESTFAGIWGGLTAEDKEKAAARSEKEK